MTATPARPTVLCILDGWGERAPAPDNAIALAHKPNWDRLVATCPRGTLNASEEHVGLPRGQMGNSEVGHMNIGAGRVVMQDLPRIDRAILDGTLAENPRLLRFLDRLEELGGTCHLLGLVSPGGVHGHQAHLAAVTRIVSGRGIKVAIHAFLDGRDTPPQSAREYLSALDALVGDLPGVSIATLCGRFYAMDRNQHWGRIEAAYDAIVDGKGLAHSDPLEAIDAAYERGETDEFILPSVSRHYRGVHDGDGVLMTNFRADRARQILEALLDPEFGGFRRKHVVRFGATLGMVEYSYKLSRLIAALFPSETLHNTLGAVVSSAGMTQLRIAETEKYAHVTFFFNGGREEVYPGEDRILVPSPAVRTYDLKPEMSAFEVTDKLCEAIRSGAYDFITVNFANGDMVGHTGDLKAAIRAIEALDLCIGRVEQAVRLVGGALLITADHGNAEMMLDPESAAAHTAHTLNIVPIVLVNGPRGVATLSHGRLADIAPTVLSLLAVPQPDDMTGQSLLRFAVEQPQRRSASA